MHVLNSPIPKYSFSLTFSSYCYLLIPVELMQERVNMTRFGLDPIDKFLHEGLPLKYLTCLLVL